LNEGWENKEAAFSDVNIYLKNILQVEIILIILMLFFKIQYSMGRPGGQNDTTCSYFGNIAINKKDRTCQGLKICEFADLELKEMEHKSVDSDLRLKINQELSTSNKENNTFA